MHKVSDEIAASVDIPLIHIADATGIRLVKAGITNVGLLGTRFTMEQAFYKNRLSEIFDIEVQVPEKTERQLVHDVIYQELCRGQVTDKSRDQFLAIIEQLQQKGAQAVILGCTEIALLVSQSDTQIALFNTTEIHAAAAVEFALEDNSQ